ncbi:SPOSA6832_03484, partial [Sporobolomyces salmonicolor]
MVRRDGLASKLAAAQAAGLAATPGYNPGAAAQQQSSPYPPAPSSAQGAFPNQQPSNTGFGQQTFSAPAGQSSPYGQPQQQQQYSQSSPYGQASSPYGQASSPYGGGAPPPVPGGRPGQAPPTGQLPYPGQQYGQPQQGYNQAPQGQFGGGGYGQQPPQQGYGPPPPPSYGQPPAQQGGGGAATNPDMILNVLRQGVQDQKVSAFFPPGSLEQIAQRVAHTGSLARLAAEWRLPLEVAFDLCRLALFDVVLYLDDSGSMAFEENGSRIEDLKLVVSRVAQAAALFDEDGLQVKLPPPFCPGLLFTTVASTDPSIGHQVRFMNSRVEGNNIASEQQANQLISQVKFSGLTPLGTALDQKILQPLVLGPARQGTLRKPVLIIAVTDGAPGGEDRYTLAKAREIFSFVKPIS